MLNNNENHTQIFLSFDALKGFRERLKEQERIVVPKKILSEDDLDELDRKIKQLRTGMIIQITCFDHDQYVQIKGMLSKINYENKTLQIIKTRIAFQDIVDIQADEIIDTLENF